MELPKFSVEYIDGTSFVGESLTGDWKTIDKSIKSLQFSFGKITTVLTDFQSYNHLIEKIAIVGKKGEIITKYLIMGRINDKTYIFEYDLKVKRAKKRIVPIGQEYGHFEVTDEVIGETSNHTPIYKEVFVPQPITGWKNGIENGMPKFKHGNF